MEDVVAAEEGKAQLSCPGDSPSITLSPCLAISRIELNEGDYKSKASELPIEFSDRDGDYGIDMDSLPSAQSAQEVSFEPDMTSSCLHSVYILVSVQAFSLEKAIRRFC